MLDLHAHVLPGIDDGPRSMAESIGLLRALAQDGVTHVVATPHIYPGVFDNSWQGIADRFNELALELDQLKLPLGVSFAAEVRLCGEMIDWLHAGDLPVMAGPADGSFSVLVELPDGTVPVGAEALLKQMVRSGITPIIAHPERNRAIMEVPDKAVAMVRLGCKLQLTAGSLLGEFGERAASTAITLLESGAATLVASDSHNLRARAPRMGAARAWLSERYGPETAHALTYTNPMAVAGRAVGAVRGAEGLILRELPVRFVAVAPVRPEGLKSSAAGAMYGLRDLPDAQHGETERASDPRAEVGVDGGQSAAGIAAGPTAVPEEWRLPALQDLGAPSLFPDTSITSDEPETETPWLDTIREEMLPPLREFGRTDDAEELASDGSWEADAALDATPPPTKNEATSDPEAAPRLLPHVPVLQDAVGLDGVPYLRPSNTRASVSSGLAPLGADPRSPTSTEREHDSSPGLLVK